VQDDAEDHHDEAGDDRGEAGPDPRREVPEVRVEPRAQAGALRRVHGVQQLPGVQVRQAEVHRLVCPKDGGDVVERKSKRGKVFYGCANYPDCDFVLWNKPMLEPCPQCKATFLVEKITKRHGRQLLCNTEGATTCGRRSSRRLESRIPSRSSLNLDRASDPSTWESLESAD
jgi:hypothetical protein